jgi:transposase
MITLGIDYGSTNIGIALVKNAAYGENVPLFAVTMRIDARWLKEKSETRSGIRSLRRTRKTKKRRLEKLRATRTASGLIKEQVRQIVHFSERRYGANQDMSFC